MAVSEFHSANGYAIKIAVERKSRSGVFGRDFISGGLIDYFSQTGDGFWLVAKCGLTASNAGTLLREAVYSRLGSYPFTMPETNASHLIVGLWEGSPSISEEELVAYIGAWVGRSQVFRQTRRLQDDVQAGTASLKEREQALRRELRDWKENKSLRERWTERYIAGAIRGVEKELKAVEWLLARTDDPSSEDSLAQEAITMPITKLVELMEKQEHLTVPELEALRKISECQEIHRDVLDLLSAQGYLEHLEDSHLHPGLWRLSVEGKVALELLRTQKG